MVSVKAGTIFLTTLLIDMKYDYKTCGTCSRSIQIDVDDDNNVIREVVFNGGCAGNTQGVAALVKGMTCRDAADRLRGIRCGAKPTSCPDQLAIALDQISQS